MLREHVEIVFDAQRFRSMNGPMRVIEKLACERDQIRLSGTENLLGMMGFRNQTERNGLDSDFAPHAYRVGYVISRSARHECGIDGAGDAARRTGDHVDATRH